MEQEHIGTIYRGRSAQGPDPAETAPVHGRFLYGHVNWTHTYGSS